MKDVSFCRNFALVCSLLGKIKTKEQCHCGEWKSDTNVAATSIHSSIPQGEEIKQISPTCSARPHSPLACPSSLTLSLSLLLFHLLLLTSNNYLSLFPPFLPLSGSSQSSLPFHLGHKCLSGDDILRITGNGNWKRRTRNDGILSGGPRSPPRLNSVKSNAGFQFVLSSEMASI